MAGVHLAGDSERTLRDDPSIARPLGQPHHVLLRIGVADNRGSGVAIFGPSDHDVVLSLNFKQGHAALLSGRARRNTTPVTGMVAWDKYLPMMVRKATAKRQRPATRLAGLKPDDQIRQSLQPQFPAEPRR